MAPPNKPFDRRTATTYALVHREQSDALTHDPEAPSQILNQISGPPSNSQTHPLPHSISHSSKVKHRHDLEPEFAAAGLVRANEGEAAEHGVFFDDSKYDYMQHMRDLGQGDGGSAWVDAPSIAQEEKKRKGKQRLEDALRDFKLDGGELEDTSSLGGMSVFTGSQAGAAAGAPKRSVYEQQQEVPDALRGFHPDLDPRLREVMEALDDEAYVDDEEEIFGELTAEGEEEMDLDEWEASGLDVGNDDGWESDDTTKPVNEYESKPSEMSVPATTTENSLPDPHEAPPDTEPFQLPPNPLKASTKADHVKPPSIARSAAHTADTGLTTGRRKKRKGALTSSAGMSMTSSALARTEPLSTLDSRFDRVLDTYMEDIGEEDDEFPDDSMSAISGMTGMSRRTGKSSFSRSSRIAGGPSGSIAGRESGDEAPPLSSNVGFNNAMDDFLGSNSGGKKGRKMRKAGREGVWGQQDGISQLDEIRKGLGPARTQGSGGGGVKV